MADQSLAVELRSDTGKGFARRLRSKGRVPAVVYGHGQASVSLSIESSELENLLKTSHAGLNTLIDLRGVSEVKGKVVLIKELQRHPVAGTLVHADFFEIDSTEKIHVLVPIRLIGIPAGVNLGGVLEHTMREIDLACLPTSIPDAIEIDVAALEINESLHVSDLTMPEGVETTIDSSLSIAHVAVPKVDETLEAEAEAEAVEGEAAEAEGAAGDKEAGDKDDDSKESNDK